MGGLHVPTGVVTEAGLASLRAGLSPLAVLEELGRHGVVLLRLSVGVGKSHLADAMLSSPDTFDQYDLVVYLAPTRAILKERSILAGRSSSPVPFMLLEPRPADRCGVLAPQWSELEGQGCTALAKASLCPACENNTDEDPCCWRLRESA